MNYPLGITCGFLAILALGGFMHVRRKRVKRLESSDIDIPSFLRRENAGDNPISDSEVHTTRIHPWGKG